MILQQTTSPQRFTHRQLVLSQEISSLIEVGDIMLSSTHSPSYHLIRTLLHVEYDHLSVFLDRETVIHISWPRVRIIHPITLLSSLSKFKIVRPQFENEQERRIFLNILKSSINAKYDVKQLLKGITNKLISNLSSTKSQNVEWIDPETKDLKLQKSQVCTDLIFYALSIASQKFRNLLKDQIQFLDYRLVGSFCTDDLEILIKQTGYFKLIKEKEIEHCNLQQVKSTAASFLMITFRNVQALRKSQSKSKKMELALQLLSIALIRWIQQTTNQKSSDTQILAQLMLNCAQVMMSSSPKL